MNAMFVHDVYDCFLEKRELDLAILEACTCVSEFNIASDQLKDRIEFCTFFDESVDDLMLILEKEGESFVGKIGEKIIGIFNKFFSFIQGIGEKFTSLFRKKQDDQAFINAMQQSPAIAEGFLENIRKGNVKYADIKDLEEAIKVAEEIVNNVENDAYGVEKASDKVNKAISKIDSKLKPLAGLLGTVGAIAAGATAIIGFRNACTKNHLEGAKLNKKMALIKAKAEEKVSKEYSGQTAGKWVWFCRLQSKICEEESRRQSIFLKGATRAADFMDKHTPYKKKAAFKPSLNVKRTETELNQMNLMDKGESPRQEIDYDKLANSVSGKVASILKGNGGNNPKPKP